jgi:hypothetical protein
LYHISTVKSELSLWYKRLMMLWLAYLSLASQVTQCVPQNENGIIATLWKALLYMTMRANKVASKYELQIFGNASIICFNRDIVIVFLISFLLFVYEFIKNWSVWQKINFANFKEYWKKNVYPFQNIELFLKMRPKIKGPLFIHLSHRGVNRFQLCPILKSVIRFAGYNPVQYNTHYPYIFNIIFLAYS